MSTADELAPPPDAAPIEAAEAAALLADLASLPAAVLAVSGGPDSTALLWLVARWRAGLATGPRLLAVTVDHALRPEAAAEAMAVARLAAALGVAQRTLRWRGDKPATRLQEAARVARYRLLAEAARDFGAGHILTAHTRDDQAETVLFRLARGSGMSGLAGMARVAPVPCLDSEMKEPPTPDPSPPFADANVGRGVVALPPSLPEGDEVLASRGAEALPLPSPGPLSSWRGGVGGGGPAAPAPSMDAAALVLVRPFLEVAKSRLMATLVAAGVPFAEDPSNRDPRFTRVRMRTLLPALAAEGLTAERLARLAARLRRADAALEAAVDRLAADLGVALPPAEAVVLDAAGWLDAPAELRLRLLGRLVAALGHEGEVELGKLETVAGALAAAAGPGVTAARFRRTLAGAMITLAKGRIAVAPAPARGPLR